MNKNAVVLPVVLILAAALVVGGFVLLKNHKDKVAPTPVAVVEEPVVAGEDGKARFAVFQVGRRTAEDVGNLRVKRRVMRGIPRLVEPDLTVERFRVVPEIREDQNAPAVERAPRRAQGERGGKRSMFRPVRLKRGDERRFFESAFDATAKNVLDPLAGTKQVGRRRDGELLF